MRPVTIDESAGALNWPTSNRTEQSTHRWFAVVSLPCGQWRGNCYWHTQAFPKTKHSLVSSACLFLTTLSKTETWWVCCSNRLSWHFRLCRPIACQMIGFFHPVSSSVFGEATTQARLSSSSMPISEDCQVGGRRIQPAPDKAAPPHSSTHCATSPAASQECSRVFLFLSLLPVALCLNPTWWRAGSCRCTEPPISTHKEVNLLIQQAGFATSSGSVGLFIFFKPCACVWWIDYLFAPPPPCLTHPWHCINCWNMEPV